MATLIVALRQRPANSFRRSLVRLHVSDGYNRFALLARAISCCVWVFTLRADAAILDDEAESIVIRPPGSVVPVVVTVDQVLLRQTDKFAVQFVRTFWSPLLKMPSRTTLALVFDRVTALFGSSRCWMARCRILWPTQCWRFWSCEGTSPWFVTGVLFCKLSGGQVGKCYGQRCMNGLLCCGQRWTRRLRKLPWLLLPPRCWSRLCWTAISKLGTWPWRQGLASQVDFDLSQHVCACRGHLFTVYAISMTC